MLESAGGNLTAATDAMAGISDRLPLKGRRILITRAAHQASELADGLRRLGATIILIPTIEIGPPSSFAALDAAIASLDASHLVAFTSANAVRAFAERAEMRGSMPPVARIAVVGPATARAAEAIGLRVDVMPPKFTAASLAETLLPEVRGHKVLLVLAEDAPNALESTLTAGGAEVHVAAAYSNRIPKNSLSEITELLSEPDRMPDAVTFTSASTARNLAALLDAGGLSLPDSVARISIGPVTSRELFELGVPTHAEAAEATIDALIQAVRSHLNREP